MRIEWQLVALSVLVVASGACVPAGSKTSEDTTEDTVDDGSGGEKTDTAATEDVCYPSSLTTEVSDCLEEANGDGYRGVDGWDQARAEAVVEECRASEARAYAVAYREALEEEMSCWEKCAGGLECAAYYRALAPCMEELYNCYANVKARGCNRDDYGDLMYQCWWDSQYCTSGASAHGGSGCW